MAVSAAGFGFSGADAYFFAEYPRKKSPVSFGTALFLGLLHGILLPAFRLDGHERHESFILHGAWPAGLRRFGHGGDPVKGRQASCAVMPGDKKIPDRLEKGQVGGKPSQEKLLHHTSRLSTHGQGGGTPPAGCGADGKNERLLTERACTISGSSLRFIVPVETVFPFPRLHAEKNIIYKYNKLRILESRG